MHIHWSKDNSYTSLYQTFIIPRLPRFEKMALSQFQLYIETEKMAQYFVCLNYQNTILVRAVEGREKGFFILHLLIIHNGFCTHNKIKLYDLYLKK